jgi:exodeoxyribonuclease III
MITLYSWNVNGIRAVLNKGAFQAFMDEHKPDILGLQETKAHQEQVEIDLPDYIENWNSAERKGYSSTAIFSNTQPLSIINNFPPEIAAKYPQLSDKYGDTNNEGRVTTAEFEDFYFVTAYVPNSKGDLTRLGLREKAWDPAFLDLVQHLEKTKPVIFCGDLNVAHQEQDLARPAENVGKHGFTDEERAGFQKFIDAGFVDTFRMFKPKSEGDYTWWTAWGGARARNVGWRIDYFLVSAALKDKVVAADIHPDVMGSDHCPVSIVLDI